MEKLINKFLDLSKSVEYYYQLKTKDKIQLYNYCDYIGKIDLYVFFMYEEISLNKLMYGLTKESYGVGRIAPSKKYLTENKRINTFTYKNLTRQEYHVERKKIYENIEKIKYLYNYKKNLNAYLLENDFCSANEKIINKIVCELNNIDEFIKKNKP